MVLFSDKPLPIRQTAPAEDASGQTDFFA